MTIDYKTRGTCSSRMHIDVEDGVVRSLQVEGGCSGNLQGLCRLVAGMKVEEVIARLAEDIAGGLVVTAPSEADLRDPKVGPYVEKYFRAAPGVSTEDRLRILRLIENLALGTAAVGYRTESMHGAGSPQAQRIMIARQGNLPMKKRLAKQIAHIKD